MASLRALTLAGFRNLHDSHHLLPPEGVAIVGRNAQGKSSFLEAIYYLETMRSFRGSPEEGMIRHGSGHFRIVGEVLSQEEGASPRSIAAAFDRSSRVRRFTVEGASPPRMAEGIGLLGVVLFTPDDVRLVTDGPKDRRRFLDIVLSLDDPGYLEALQRFRQVLLQRNAVLRKGGSPAEVLPWNPLLLQAGARIAWGRATWVERMRASFARICTVLSGGTLGSIAYRTAGFQVRPEATLTEVQELYAEALERSGREELRLRATQIGPHRDDLVLGIGDWEEGGVEARGYASGGERRTLALALRLIEAETVRVRRREEPILLLDDIFAELDEERAERVVQLLDPSKASQVILTAPRRGDLRFRAELLPRWEMEGGILHHGKAR